MRTRALFTSVLASISILVAGWQLSDKPQQDVTADASTTGLTTQNRSAGTPPGNGNAGSTGSGTGAGAGTASSGSAGTFTGATSTHRYGSVSVSITTVDGTLTDVTAQDGSRDGRSRQIASRAEPILRDEVLTAQSADISMVSGATYTSSAYITSLQSALDQAGL